MRSNSDDQDSNIRSSWLKRSTTPLQGEASSPAARARTRAANSKSGGDHAAVRCHPPGSAFIQQLIQLEWLVPTGQPKDGDILVYFDGTTPKHAGKCWHGIVESKWGLGHLWRHPQCEVPLSYGDDTGALERVDGLTASEWFVKYAEAE